ncbi:hypothetical protein AGLY_009719 [Aphis glycines]|uniref:Uncharacterized protein n=1 Tax=Aphis glycines TaxID=307491 RepID=A0A6G0TIV9_APHGL|nr:hypothetical protein AGLY_009719 [Aphis glycines]
MFPIQKRVTSFHHFIDFKTTANAIIYLSRTLYSTSEKAKGKVVFDLCILMDWYYSSKTMKRVISTWYIPVELKSATVAFILFVIVKLVLMFEIKHFPGVAVFHGSFFSGNALHKKTFSIYDRHHWEITITRMFTKYVGRELLSLTLRFSGTFIKDLKHEKKKSTSNLILCEYLFITRFILNLECSDDVLLMHQV